MEYEEEEIDEYYETGEDKKPVAQVMRGRGWHEGNGDWCNQQLAMPGLCCICFPCCCLLYTRHL